MATKGKRRPRGEGTIYQRASDKRYVAALIVNGKRKPFYGHTEEEVQHKLNEARYLRDQGKLVTGKSQTVRQFLTSWYENNVAPSASYSTAIAYRQNVQYLCRHLGKYPLTELSPQHIQRAYSVMQETLSASYVAQMHTRLRQALNFAVACHYLSWNPASACTPPPQGREEMHPLSKEELRTLLEWSKGTIWHALWSVLGTTGMRGAEARGLLWTNLDEAARQMRIERQVQHRSHDGWWFVNLKTGTSRRTVLLTPSTLRALESHRPLVGRMRLQRQDWQDKGLIFPSIHGTPMYRDIVATALDRAMDELGLPRIRVHDLRHTCATLLLREGADVKQVSQMLGHADVVTTLRIYHHVLPSMHEDAARRMEALVGG